MSGQTKLASFIEACVNTGVGFVFSFFIQKVLNYTYDITMTNDVVAWFVFWFTVASIFRGYVVRRIANLPYWENRKRSKSIREVRGKSTTQVCACGCTHLVLLSSLNFKVCTDCGEHIPWHLEDGQKPLL